MKKEEHGLCYYKNGSVAINNIKYEINYEDRVNLL